MRGEKAPATRAQEGEVCAGMPWAVHHAGMHALPWCLAACRIYLVHASIHWQAMSAVSALVASLPLSPYPHTAASVLYLSAFDVPYPPGASHLYVGVEPVLCNQIVSPCPAPAPAGQQQQQSGEGDGEAREEDGSGEEGEGGSGEGAAEAGDAAARGAAAAEGEL